MAFVIFENGKDGRIIILIQRTRNVEVLQNETMDVKRWHIYFKTYGRISTPINAGALVGALNLAGVKVHIREFFRFFFSKKYTLYALEYNIQN